MMADKDCAAKAFEFSYGLTDEEIKAFGRMVHQKQMKIAPLGRYSAGSLSPPASRWLIRAEQSRTAIMACRLIQIPQRWSWRCSPPFFQGLRRTSSCILSGTSGFRPGDVSGTRKQSGSRWTRMASPYQGERQLGWFLGSHRGCHLPVHRCFSGMAGRRAFLPLTFPFN